LFRDHDARRIEIADLVDQPAVLDPNGGAQQSGAKQADPRRPSGLPLVDEVIDSIDRPLEHIESEEGVAARVRTDSNVSSNSFGKTSLPRFTVNHGDQG
jgi:hypothetical protein